MTDDFGFLAPAYGWNEGDFIAFVQYDIVGSIFIVDCHGEAAQAR
jgi:hypothetical protein